MSKKKERKTHDYDVIFDLDTAQVGDVVEIRWCDVHAYERIEMSEIEELDEPESTVCWGAIVRKSEKYLFIASEIGDKDSDGVWIEAIPYRLIESCMVISSIKI